MSDARGDGPEPQIDRRLGRLMTGLPIAVPLVAAAMSWEGYVLKTCWNWFVPEIYGIGPLSLGSATATCVVLQATRSARSSPKVDKEFAEVVLDIFIGPATVLLMGWCLRRLVLAGYLTL